MVLETSRNHPEASVVLAEVWTPHEPTTVKRHCGNLSNM